MSLLNGELEATKMDSNEELAKTQNTHVKTLCSKEELC